jgi:RHS repeat-associated protein
MDLSQSTEGAGGVGGLISVVDTAEVYHFLYDANGNIGQLIKASDGSISAHYEYDPFGILFKSTGAKAGDNPFRFSTKYYDTETDLYYYGYRYYSPLLGRWINRDPIEEKGGLNLYGFINNNPISNFDVYGLLFTPKSEADWILLRWAYLGGGNYLDISECCGTYLRDTEIRGYLMDIEDQIKMISESLAGILGKGETKYFTIKGKKLLTVMDEIITFGDSYHSYLLTCKTTGKEGCCTDTIYKGVLTSRDEWVDPQDLHQKKGWEKYGFATNLGATPFWFGLSCDINIDAYTCKKKK